jgi:transcriptional regulator with XRE-family HTH domain
MRRQKGFNIKQLSEKIGYTDNLISQVEHEHRRPWPVLRQKVAAVLGVGEADIFTAGGWPRKVNIDSLLTTASGKKSAV